MDTQITFWDYQQAVIDERRDAAISAWEQCRDALPMQKVIVDEVFASYLSMFDGRLTNEELYSILMH